MNLIGLLETSFTSSAYIGESGLSDVKSTFPLGDDCGVPTFERVLFRREFWANKKCLDFFMCISSVTRR